MSTVTTNRKNKLLATNLFLAKLHVNKNDIQSIKPIHNGYTNESFLFTLKSKQKYQVRLSHTKKSILNRNSEYDVLKLINDKDFIYYDPKTGNAIKKWIIAKHPNNKQITSKWFLDKLFKQIAILHKNKYHAGNNHVPKLDFLQYKKHINKLPKVIGNLFVSLANKYNNYKNLVLNHSDINKLNILINNQQVYLIDYEWARYSHNYWDYAIFLSQIKYNEKLIISLLKKYIKNFNYKILKEFIFIALCFAYLWTYIMPQTIKIKQYRKFINKMLKIRSNIESM